MNHVRIFIRHRVGVFDPESKMIESGLHRLGFEHVDAVVVNKVIELVLNGPEETLDERVHEMCQQFLVNPILEDYTFEINKAHDS